jgi:hypothetical protein
VVWEISKSQIAKAHLQRGGMFSANGAMLSGMVFLLVYYFVCF